MAMEMEVVNQVPTRISKEAWETAMVISVEVAGLLAEHGITAREGSSESTKVMAKMVQLAINKSYEKWQAAKLESHDQQ